MEVKQVIVSSGMEAEIKFNTDFMSAHDYKLLSEELEAFNKHFWDMTEECWHSVLPDGKETAYIVDFFCSKRFITPTDNELIQSIEEQLRGF